MDVPEILTTPVPDCVTLVPVNAVPVPVKDSPLTLTVPLLLCVTVPDAKLTPAAVTAVPRRLSVAFDAWVMVPVIDKPSPSPVAIPLRVIDPPPELAPCVMVATSKEMPALPVLTEPLVVPVNVMVLLAFCKMVKPPFAAFRVIPRPLTPLPVKLMFPPLL